MLCLNRHTLALETASKRQDLANEIRPVFDTTVQCVEGPLEVGVLKLCAE